MITTRESEDAGLFDTWRSLLRRRWLSGLIAFWLVAVTAIGLVFFTRPIYRAEARIRLGDPPPSGGVTPTAGGFFGLPRMGSDPFANDMELLSSRTMTERLIDDVALNAEVHAPRGWYRDSVLTRLTATRATAKARFDVRWEENGRISVRQMAPEEKPAGDVAPGAPISFGGVTAVFRPWRPGAPRTVSIRTVPFGEAVRVIRTKIHSERTRREANVIDLRFDNADPGVAKAATASVVNGFVELRTQIMRRESGETVDSLRAVANETLGELKNAESGIQDLAQRTLLVSPDTQSKAVVARYNVTLDQLERARAELNAVNAVLARVETVHNPTEAWTALAAYPRFLDNSTVGDMLSRLTGLEERRSEMASRRTEGNRDFQVVNEQITYLDHAMRSLAYSYRTEMVQQVATLEARLRALDAQMKQVPGTIVDFTRRQRSARILSDFMVLTEMRLRQEELRQALTFANVQIIDPPELRYKPIWPRKGIGLAVGGLLALMTALLAMVVVDRAASAPRGRAMPAAALTTRQREIAGALEQ